VRGCGARFGQRDFAPAAHDLADQRKCSSTIACEARLGACKVSETSAQPCLSVPFVAGIPSRQARSTTQIIGLWVAHRAARADLRVAPVNLGNHAAPRQFARPSPGTSGEAIILAARQKTISSSSRRGPRVGSNHEAALAIGAAVGSYENAGRISAARCGSRPTLGRRLGERHACSRQNECNRATRWQRFIQRFIA